ncbi:MAG: class I SAM-dependent methyltransferase [Aureispira sp.]
MNEEIKAYYNKIANEYHQSRFSNSYGQFIHQQEDVILDKYLNKTAPLNGLDLACGTGRFLDYASHGVDISEHMLKIAQEKYPDRNLQLAAGEDLPFENDYFQQVLSFHLMMHLEHETLQLILKEVHRVTKKGGLFIFDIPSAKRRKLTRYTAKSWHGGNQIYIHELKKMLGNQWELVHYQGIAFFPLHRIPKRLRPIVRPLDSWFCTSTFKELSSHLVVVLQKK